MRLYEIIPAYKNIESLLDDPELDVSLLTEAVEQIDGDLKAKASNIAMVIENYEALAAQIKEAEQRMAMRRKRIENRAGYVRDYLLRHMIAAGIKKIECVEFRLTVRNNPERVVIEDGAVLPDEYMRIPEPLPAQPDKKKILSDMKVGVCLDGVRIEQGHSLIIS